MLFCFFTFLHFNYDKIDFQIGKLPWIFELLLRSQNVGDEPIQSIIRKNSKKGKSVHNLKASTFCGGTVRDFEIRNTILCFPDIEESRRSHIKCH